MRNLVFFLFLLLSVPTKAQILQDNFEGSGNISTWVGDNCEVTTNFTNPHQVGINNSAKVLRYSDTGGQFANVRFTAATNFNLVTSALFFQ